MSSFADLQQHRYLAVETLRRNGIAVVTPVWFVLHDGQIYFSAPAHTGKVKRLRHTPRGRVAPCDQRGQILGEWQPVRIEPLADAHVAMIDQLLAKRYGWQRRLIDTIGWLRRWKYCHYVVMPNDGS